MQPEGSRELPSPVALALVGLLGCLMALPLLRIPLVHDDQSLFRLIADTLSSGGRLYSDIWDVKQPGIFWVYWIGQSLKPGTLASGVHWLFVAWMGATSVAAAVVAALAMPGRRVWMLAPLLTVPFYVLRLEVFTIGQLEGLVPLFILVTIAGVVAVQQGKLGAPMGYAIAGLMVGATAVFKLLLAVVPGVLLVLGLLHLLLGGRTRQFWQGLFAASAGTAVVIGLVLLLFASQGSLSLFLWTVFEYPPAALSLADLAPWKRLLTSTLSLGSTTILLIPAAFYGARAVRWPGWRSRLGWVTVLLLAWFAMTALVVLSQRMSWHAYHFALMAWPIGMLAALGIAQARLTASNRLTATVLLVLALAGIAVNILRDLTRDLTLQDRAQQRLDLEQLAALRASVANSGCRTSMVFGNPGLVLASGLKPVSSLTGQLAPYLLADQWRDLEAIVQQRVPAYIYIGAEYDDVLARRSPLLTRWIPTRYTLLESDAFGGRWLIRSATEATPCLGVAGVGQ